MTDCMLSNLRSHGALQFASYYQDHMVLQRGPQQAVVWGHATKIGDSVSVQISGKGSVTGQVNKDAVGHGMWKVKLPATTDKGPFTVTATSSEGTVTIKDVLFGDVWLCSGQSNMEFSVNGVFNNTEEIAASLKYRDIRLMKVYRNESSSLLSDLIHAPWTHPTSYVVKSFSAVCWFFGEYLFTDVKYPIGLIESNWGATPIEVWSSPEALAVCRHQQKKRAPNRDSVLWNSMINPLLEMTIYGTIWYQGEANAVHPDIYSCQFAAMINDWRKKFHEASLGETGAEFPFGFVQLGPYHKSPTRIGGYPPLRWSQTAKLGEVPNIVMKNVFMAVAMDLSDYDSPAGGVHSRYKQDVARRLEFGALAVAYQDNTVKYQGPFPKTFAEDKNHKTLLIVYDHNPIEVRSSHGFEICCSASTTKCSLHDQWVETPIQSHLAFAVAISTSGCGNKHAVGVRYAWRESPCDYKQCAIYGRDTSLPAPPYIHTDGFGTGPSIIGK